MGGSCSKVVGGGFNLKSDHLSAVNSNIGDEILLADRRPSTAAYIFSTLSSIFASCSNSSSNSFFTPASASASASAFASASASTSALWALAFLSTIRDGDKLEPFPYHYIILVIMIVLYMYCLIEGIPAAFKITPSYRSKRKEKIAKYEKEKEKEEGKGSGEGKGSTEKMKLELFGEKESKQEQEEEEQEEEHEEEQERAKSKTLLHRNINRNRNRNRNRDRNMNMIIIRRLYHRIANFCPNVHSYKLTTKQISSLLHLICGLFILVVPFLMYLIDGTRLGEWERSINKIQMKNDNFYNNEYVNQPHSRFHSESIQPIHLCPVFKLNNDGTNINDNNTTTTNNNNRMMRITSVALDDKKSEANLLDFQSKSYLYRQDIVNTLQNIEDSSSSLVLLSSTIRKEIKQKQKQFHNEKETRKRAESENKNIMHNQEQGCITIVPVDIDDNNNNKNKKENYDDNDSGNPFIYIYRYNYQYHTPLWLYLLVLFVSLISILSGLHLIYLRVPYYDIASIRGYTVAVTSGLSYMALGALFRLRIYQLYYPIAC